MSGLASGLDWSRPWLAPYRAVGEMAAARWASGGSAAQALNDAAAGMAAAGPHDPVRLPVRFVPQSRLPRDEAYEPFVHRTGCVPTRDNLHDFFNGLVWLRWPELKASVSRAHAEHIADQGVGASRGAVRDALTLFDESGALWCAPSALVEALRSRDWQALFVRQRALWRDARLWLFGHALLEKLTQPRKPITAHCVLADANGTPLTPLDKPFLTLPVLGVPGWWPANESTGFYDDASVFRPAQAVSVGRKPSIDR